MPFAIDGQISQEYIEGGIEISEAEYRWALDHMLAGRQFIVVDGQLQLQEINVEDPVSPEKPSAPTLDELKAEKLKSIDASRDAGISGGFSFGEHTFDSDVKSVQRISSIATLVLMNPDFSTPYVTQNNDVITLDAQSIMGLGAALAEHEARYVFHARALKDQVLIADTEEQLALIEWTEPPISESESGSEPKYPQFTALQMLDLFTEEEQLAVVAATLQVPEVKLWYDRLIAATFVTYEDPRTEAGLQALVDAQLLDPGRKDEIVGAMQPETETT